MANYSPGASILIDQGASGTGVQKTTKKMADTAFEQLIEFVYLDNADKKKYGSLLHNLSK